MTRVHRPFQLIYGDCFKLLDSKSLPVFDLIYLDPPFCSQKKQSLTTRKGDHFEFDDVWHSYDEYANFLYVRLRKMHLLLSDTGSLFFHCDPRLSYIARMVLDKVFGLSNFQSEIIWHYRRWSNSKKGLLRTHQTILFYTKTNNFKFRSVFLPYSDTTNIDQILQCRARDDQGKTVYAYDDQGKIIMSTAKCGVPLGDVWEIPFLNPKAAERIGYPTQKPILLLERIIQLVTDPGDWVLDPFCGSGTTLVAAKLLRRNSIGMDISMDAINLAHQRLNCPIRTDSQILKKDKNLYYQSKKRIVTHLGDLDFALVPKNKGVDAILKKTIDGRFVFIRLQRDTETVMDAVRALKKAASAKGNPWLVVIQTSRKRKTLFDKGDTADVFVVPSVYLMLLKLLRAEGADPTNHIPL